MSAAKRPFAAEELTQLLDLSRVRNAERDLTGMLLYKTNSFIQLLEGERSSVEAMYAHIARDPRHGQLIVIHADTIAKRMFPSWRMGFRALEADARTPGFTTFLETSATAEAFGPNPTQAQKLLMLFKETI